MKKILFIVIVIFSFWNITLAQTTRHCNVSVNMAVGIASTGGGIVGVQIAASTGTIYGPTILIYADGVLIKESKSEADFVHDFPIEANPYDVYIECVAGCRRDGCVVVIEPSCCD